MDGSRYDVPTGGVVESVSNTDRSTPAFDELLAFANTVDRPFDCPDKLADLFDRFLRDGDYARMLEQSLRRLASCDVDVIDGAERGTLVLHRNNKLQLVIQQIPASRSQSTLLSTSPSSALIAVVSRTATLGIDQYRLPPGTDLSVFDPAARLNHVTTRTLAHDEPPLFCKAGDVLDAHLNGDVAIVRLVDSTAMPYQWMFDSNSLVPLFVGAALPALSRTETLIDAALSIEGDGGDFADLRDTLVSLVDHPLHFIRWKAAQALATVAPPDAVDALKKLQNDRHPHIRNAALKAVGKLETA